MPFVVKPTSADLIVANAVAKHASPIPEEIASILTLAADERVLLALAGVTWLRSRQKPQASRVIYNHALVVSIASAVLPHLLKTMFSQTRPDRLTVRGHLKGIPVSGRREDAFPSGHALHMGALASFASSLPHRPRMMIEGASFGLSLSRIVLLAHWTSDVVVGFAIGSLLERALRTFTGYRTTPKKPARD
jgi:membrane-associated phospholipid phosphatase